MEPQLIKKEPLGRGYYAYVSPRHTFGTDAVLLYDFSSVRRGERMVDLGTGCGIIPLLALRDGRPLKVAGVEINHEAAQLALRTSLELSLENFNVIECDLKQLKGRLEFGCNTLVTCNPPYKAPNAGIKNADAAQSVARHEVACTLEDIISTAARLLRTSGRLCMCHRPERLCELMSMMSKHGLEPKRLRLVCQRHGVEPWLVLVEGKKCSKTGLRIAPTLYIEENGALSDEMVKIYGAYKEAYL